MKRTAKSIVPIADNNEMILESMSSDDEDSNKPSIKPNTLN